MTSTDQELILPEPPFDCNFCPRLVEFRAQNKINHPEWFNGPAPSFGSNNANLLIVGLAPGLQGANKTGRPFTGDYAGDLLYSTLLKFGFAKGEYLARPDDTLELVRTMITNAVRCVPPQNKPVGAEINTCRRFLSARINALPNLRAIICLGKIAHDSTLRALGMKLKDMPFAHRANHKITDTNLTLFDSYHCSRYNTNTGRLTEEMFENLFSDVKLFLSNAKNSKEAKS